MTAMAITSVHVIQWPGGSSIAERMQKNGWKLNEAIEEYLAREAEKNPFKEPGLWQRLRWLVKEALHKIGFASDPTISDVQYLFWVSQNQLRENDPMGVVKQQAFLYNLERRAANTPYINMNAARPEDIEDKDKWGIAVIGDNLTIGAKAKVEPKAMISKDIEEVK